MHPLRDFGSRTKTYRTVVLMIQAFGNAGASEVMFHDEESHRTIGVQGQTGVADMPACRPVLWKVLWSAMFFYGNVELTIRKRRRLK